MGNNRAFKPLELQTYRRQLGRYLLFQFLIFAPIIGIYSLAEHYARIDFQFYILVGLATLQMIALLFLNRTPSFILYLKEVYPTLKVSKWNKFWLSWVWLSPIFVAITLASLLSKFNSRRHVPFIFRHMELVAALVLLSIASPVIMEVVLSHETTAKKISYFTSDAAGYYIVSIEDDVKFFAKLKAQFHLDSPGIQVQSAQSKVIQTLTTESVSRSFSSTGMIMAISLVILEDMGPGRHPSQNVANQNITALKMIDHLLKLQTISDARPPTLLLFNPILILSPIEVIESSLVGIFDLIAEMKFRHTFIPSLQNMLTKLRESPSQDQAALSELQNRLENTEAFRSMQSSPF